VNLASILKHYLIIQEREVIILADRLKKLIKLLKIAIDNPNKFLDIVLTHQCQFHILTLLPIQFNQFIDFKHWQRFSRETDLSCFSLRQIEHHDTDKIIVIF
jgi:hypothetical protein